MALLAVSHFESDRHVILGRSEVELKNRNAPVKARVFGRFAPSE